MLSVLESKESYFLLGSGGIHSWNGGRSDWNCFALDRLGGRGVYM